MDEVLILGGGLAGGAAAIQLARAGVSTRLLERDAATSHKVCGEFLSIEAQRDLERLGINLDQLGAVSVDRLRLVRGTKQVEAALPFVARGISRKILDEALLDSARAAGAIVERGVRVSRMHHGVADTNAGTRQARHIFLATGKHDLRGWRRTTPTRRDDYVGFKMHWRLEASQCEALGNAIELIMFNGGYAGLQRIASHVANLCLVIRRERLAGMGGRWENVLAALMREAHLTRRLGNAKTLFPRPLTIANQPFGYVNTTSSSACERTFRLGDQVAVTAPLTGDGMATALRSARLAADCLQSGFDAAPYHRRMEQLASGQVRRAMRLQRVTGLPVIMGPVLALLGLWPGALTSLVSMTRLPGLRLT